MQRERRRLLLTVKKSLVKSDHPPLSSVGDAVQGTVYSSFVVAIRRYGLIVAFYGGVKALLHRSELRSVEVTAQLKRSKHLAGQASNPGFFCSPLVFVEHFARDSLKG